MKLETTFKRCPGSLSFRQPKPEIIACAICGADTEIWSDETEAQCPGCGATVVRYAGQSCIDWCKHARECLGDDKYKKYGQMKAVMRKHALINALTDYFEKNTERIERINRIVTYAENILAEEPGADPNVVFAAALLRGIEKQESRNSPVAQEILRKLGYAENFISEVRGIIEHHDPVSKNINLRIVCDIDLLISSENHSPAAGFPDQAPFLASFLTSGGRKLAELLNKQA